MSIKDLFTGRNSYKFSSIKSAEEIGQEIEESPSFIERHAEDKNRFIPRIDFTTASNFAKFGSAQKYYEDSLKRIQNQYPYDGSGKEKIEWRLSSSYLENYIFDNLYPRTTGYATIAPSGATSVAAPSTLLTTASGGYGEPSTKEYIEIYGGPHTGSGETLAELFGIPAAGAEKMPVKSNIFHTASNRTTNLRLDISGSNLSGTNAGVTVEFWLKKKSFITASTQKEVIFDLWNGEATSSAGYGRFRLELSGTHVDESPFRITLMSGANGFNNQIIGTGVNTASVANDKWQHYAFSFSGSKTNVITKFYVSGTLNEEKSIGATAVVEEVTGSMLANIGALVTAPSGNLLDNLGKGWGKLSASIDEFRYWKVKRTSKEIGRNWFTQINGGTNEDQSKYNELNPVDLGVYFKFNEGITGDTYTDSTVLDYSGRISNGYWTGYSSNSRDTGSAILESSASATEFKDPIIYNFHSDVSALSSSLVASGTTHDVRNNAALYHTMPRWIVDDDIKNGGHLKNLTQILGSYLDTLHAQVGAIATLKEATYVSSSQKPFPFTNMLLENFGLTTPELFVDADIIESLLSRDEKRLYGEKLYNLKNLIYQNIYNNLTYIYKSKGTEKAFRNLFRCYGIDDEVVKINIYGNNETYKFENNFKSKTIRKNLIDFSRTGRFDANAYLYPSSSSPSFITGSVTDEKHLFTPITVETQIVFPEKFHISSPYYYHTDFITSSLFGMHAANSGSSITDTDLTWDTADYSNFQVYAVRDDRDSKHAYFMLTSSNPFPIPELTSSRYEDVYDNTKWNFAVRIKPENYPLTNFASGSLTSSYKVEFYGAHTVLDQAQNQFYVTSSITVADTASIQSFLKSNKRIYIGAHRTNFTGTVQNSSDVRFSYFRYWMNHLDNNTLKRHAIDPTTYGLENPYRNFATWLAGPTSLAGGRDLYNLYIPQIETLVLNWDFETLTGSNENGRVFIQDFSSGSSEIQERYGWLGNITGRKYVGRGDNFTANSTGSFTKEYIYSAKQQLPENIHSSDMIKTVSDQDELIFTRDTRPVDFFFSIEKSMYYSISEEMINFFASVVEFNNLIGETVNRYRPEYKDLGKLRQLFFERVRNTPDIDKYLDFYKWFDNALATILQQLVPASANMSEDVSNVIESHLLERNKYWTKYPTLDSKAPGLLGTSTSPVGFITNILDGGGGGSDQGLIGKYFRAAGMGVIQAGGAGVGIGYSLDGIGVQQWSKGWQNNPEASNPPQNTNCLTWKYQVDRTYASITSGDATVDKQRNIILSASLSNTTRFKPYTMTTCVTMPLGGGVGNATSKNREYVKQNTTFGLAKGGAAATATWTFTDKPNETTTITLTDAVGTSVVFEVDNDADGGAGTNTEMDPATNNAAGMGDIMASVVNSSALQITATTNGSGLVTLTQDHAGVEGNTAITISNYSNWNANTSATFPTSFTGGTITSPLLSAIVASDVEDFVDCLDEPFPNVKRSYSFKLTDSSSAEDYDTAGKGDLLVPFSLYSSSVNTGYAADISSSFKAGVDFTNIHVDALSDVPMQGPFTEKYVGGNQHRHVDINKFDTAKSTANNIDGQTNRTEGFYIELGPDSNVVSLVGSDYYSTDLPRATLTREEYTKRPVNIRNIKQTTGSTIIGNYEKNYQVVSTVGVELNNVYFVKNEGVSLPEAFTNDLPATTNYHTLIAAGAGGVPGNVFGANPESLTDLSNRFTTRTTQSLPRRDLTGSDSVIVSRFSAPGGPEVMSRGYLDVNAEEYSVYNALPYRNLSVRGSGSGESGSIRLSAKGTTTTTSVIDREGLSTRLTRHCGKFGTDSQFGTVGSSYDTSASFHKIHANPRRRIEMTDTDTFVTGVMYDNSWVTRPIPQSDLQYTWLTSSNHLDFYGFASSSSDITFLSASVTGAGDQFLDFVNLNTFIYDPLTSSANILSSSTGVYKNTKITSLVFEADTLNFLLLNRNGPYGYPSWKQTRTFEHPIVRYQRGQNVISISDPPQLYEVPVFISSSITGATGQIAVRAQKGGAIIQYTETPVVSRNKPIVHTFEVDNFTDTTMTQVDENNPVTDLTLQYTYGNNLDFFSNTELNEKLGLTNTSRQVYDDLVDLYVNPVLNGADNPIKKFKSIKYGEAIYPKQVNTYRGVVRSRTEYSESSTTGPEGYNRRPDQRRTFWRTKLTDRQGTKGSYRNSMDTIQMTKFSGTGSGLVTGSEKAAMSFWPLDGHFMGVASPAATPNLAPHTRITNDSGSDGELKKGTVLYHLLYLAEDLSKDIQMPASASQMYLYPTLFDVKRTEAMDSHSGSVWSAADTSGKTPWYDSYDDYAQDIRLMGKDYSIIPEFKISDHIESYLDDVDGFLADNLGFLTLDGASISSSLATDFFNIYSNSDFMKYFGTIQEDHKNVANQKNITLTCKGIKKLLPYNGFYPVLRCTQLGALFSQSMGPYTTGLATSSFVQEPAKIQSMIQPFYAPGIMYNTIKSGIAVDWATYTGSANIAGGYQGGEHFFQAGPNYRIPFESILDPTFGLPISASDGSSKIVLIMHNGDDANHKYFFHWAGIVENPYKLAINNFLAEVPNFFLERKGFTNFVSEPENKFEILETGKTYYMDVVLYRRDLVMCEGNISGGVDDFSGSQSSGSHRGRYFGPPVKYSHEAKFRGSDPAYAPWTPPYFYGTSSARLSFTPAETKRHTLDEIYSGSIVQYSNSAMGGIASDTSYTIATGSWGDTPAGKHMMQLSSSVHLFGRTFDKIIQYDKNGNVISVSDSETPSNQSRAVISTKFETPVLHFPEEANYPQTDYGRGMWMGYGYTPTGSSGIYLELKESFPTAITSESSTTGSLIDALGYKISNVDLSQKIGTVAAQKEISEAIVAIPFTNFNNQVQFYTLEREQINDALDIPRGSNDRDFEDVPEAGTSIRDMVRKMQNFVFPPKMDFVRNTKLQPFAMYIFDFKHNLTKQDLTDIWQNLMPKIATVAEKQEVIISHEIKSGEFFGNSDISSDTRWMVFKVKQKANDNYFKVTADSTDDERFQFKINVGGEMIDNLYSYNWPYDFFSLIELAKIETEVEFKNDD